MEVEASDAKIAVLQALAEQEGMESYVKSQRKGFNFILKERFRLVAYDILENQHCQPCFNDVVHFVEHQVKLLSDPVFGHIQPTERGFQVRRDVFAIKPKIRRENLATNVYAVNKQEQKQHKETKEINQNYSRCLFCSQRHNVNDCSRFTKIIKSSKHCDKISFLKEKGACFKCLNPGHWSKGCERRISCGKCKKKNHPTTLHIYVDKSVSTCDTRGSEPEPTVNNTLVSAETFGSRTGAGNSASECNK